MQEPGSSIPVECWACCRKLQAPVYHGMAVSIIKCSWCGALVEDIQLDSSNTATATSCNSNSKNDNLPPPRQHRTVQHQILGYAMAVFVFFLVTVIAASGIFIALPGALGKTPFSLILPFLQLIAGVLFVFILSAYMSILVNHPGPVRPIIEASSVATAALESFPPKEGALNDWRWCKLCMKGKPPTAHHCRRCGICVQDLDHHCLFTANKCIGAGNMKPFLLFLSLVLVGCIFAFIAAAVMGWRNRIPIIRHTLATWFRPLLFNSSLLHALSFVWRWVLTAPLPLAAWALAFMLSFSSGVGVALLLNRQVRLKDRGSTYLEELQQRRRELQVAMAAGESGPDAARGELSQDPVHAYVSKDKSM